MKLPADYYRDIARTTITTMARNMIDAMNSHNLCVKAGDRQGACYYSNRVRNTIRMLKECGYEPNVVYAVVESGGDNIQVFKSVDFNKHDRVMRNLSVTHIIGNRPNSAGHDFDV